MSTRASYQCRRASARGEHGVVLILAVLAVVLLSVLAIGITAVVRVELLASRSSLGRVQALFLAQAGLNEARAILLYDDPKLDTLQDDWGPQADEPLDEPRYLGEGFYRVRVYDACGRIDINHADAGNLLLLTGDPAVAAAIMDWRDEDDAPMPDGAEADYYQSLSYPYLPRNHLFQTPGELLLVRGVTPDQYFGSHDQSGIEDLVTVEALSLNTDVQGQQRIGVNELLAALGAALSEENLAKFLGAWAGVLTGEVVDALVNWRAELPTFEYTSLAQVADALEHYGLDFLPVLDTLCVDTPQQAYEQLPPDWPPAFPPAMGKVNVNTAPAGVLASLPGSSSQLAQAIVERRQNVPFLSLREVAELMLEQPGGPAVFASMVDRVTTKSSSFIIESTGWAGDGRTYRTLVALVRRLPDNVVVVRQAEQDWPLPPPEQEYITMARR